MSKNVNVNTLFVTDLEGMTQDLIANDYSPEEAEKRIAEFIQDVGEGNEPRVLSCNNETFVTTAEFVQDLQDLYGFEFLPHELYSLVK